jgi:hypothetical protein
MGSSLDAPVLDALSSQGRIRNQYRKVVHLRKVTPAITVWVPAVNGHKRYLKDKYAFYYLSEKNIVVH